MQLGDYRVTGVDDGSTDFLANIDTKKTEKKKGQDLTGMQIKTQQKRHNLGKIAKYHNYQKLHYFNKTTTNYFCGPMDLMYDPLYTRQVLYN